MLSYFCWCLSVWEIIRIRPNTPEARPGRVSFYFGLLSIVNPFSRLCQELRRFTEYRIGCTICSMIHPIQNLLLDLSHRHNLANMTLREMAKGISMPDESPQKIKHHLLQLQKKGFLKIDRIRGVMEQSAMKPTWAKGLLKNVSAKVFSIPIVGVASCGPATIFAEQNFEGFLRVSSRLIHQSSPKDLFAIKAEGSSMNRAEIDGKKIEDGDYVIVRKDESIPDNNDVVLVIVDGKGTIKRFINDTKNEQVVLKADSSYDYEPIHLHPSDEFFVNGKVVGIVKKPS